MLLSLAVSTRADVSPGRPGSFSSVLFLLLRSEFRSVSDIRDVAIVALQTTAVLRIYTEIPGEKVIDGS